MARQRQIIRILAGEIREYGQTARVYNRRSAAESDADTLEALGLHAEVKEHRILHGDISLSAYTLLASPVPPMCNCDEIRKSFERQMLKDTPPGQYRANND
jgi:hypothetical protein